MVEVGPVVGPWGAPQAEVASETSAAALPSRRGGRPFLLGSFELSSTNIPKDKRPLTYY